MKKIEPNYFRNLIFGAEDSLVSTVGVLFGMASASLRNPEIVLTGLIVITVEALSMGAGAFLSEKSTHELNPKSKHKDLPIIGGLIMLLSYFFVGFIPLLPYMIWRAPAAKFVSLGVTLLSLFILGYLPNKKIKSAVRMAVIAGSAVLAGFLIAFLFKNSLN
jgi:VIT1/CCC1 family predicted Fe2+/Mn2+ transporter